MNENTDSYCNQWAARCPIETPCQWESFDISEDFLPPTDRELEVLALMIKFDKGV